MFLISVPVSLSQRVCCLSLLRDYHALTRYSIHAILGIGGGGDGAGGGAKPKSAITCPADEEPAADAAAEEGDEDEVEDAAKDGGQVEAGAGDSSGSA